MNYVKNKVNDCPREHEPEISKDTEASVSDLQVPQVNAQVICRQVCLTVTVH